MKRLFILSLLLISISMQANHTVLNHSNTNGCRFEISFEEMAWDTIKTEHQTYHRIRFPDSGYPMNPGSPMLPGRTVILAVPPGATLQVNASASGVQNYQNVRLLPCPRLVKADKFHEEIYEEGEAYRQAGFLPPPGGHFF